MTANWEWRLGVVGLFSAFGITASAGASTPCGGVKTLVIAGVEIRSTAYLDKVDGAPIPHCLIEGTVEKHTDDSGNTFGISFELRLPDDWNGNYVHQFNGGIDGKIVPAFGRLLGGGLLPSNALESG